MSDGIADVLRELRAHGLLDRATSIRAGDVVVEMLAAVKHEPMDPLELAKREAEQAHETLFASS